MTAETKSGAICENISLISQDIDGHFEKCVRASRPHARETLWKDPAFSAEAIPVTSPEEEISALEESPGAYPESGGLKGNESPDDKAETIVSVNDTAGIYFFLIDGKDWCRAQDKK